MSQIFKKDGTVVPVTALVMEEIESIKVGDKVKVIGTSKGKGFAGVVKRWSFSGGPKSHGQSDRLRAPGSIGVMGVGKVMKGQKMAGRMGGNRVTLPKVEVVELDEKKKVVKIKGAVPGSRRSKVVIQVGE